MQRLFRFMAVCLVMVPIALAGCGKKEEKKEAASKPGEKREARVVVPPEVQGKWRAVKIAVNDKESGEEKFFTVDIGGEFTIAGSGISLKVKNFLPHFVMDGTTMTSASDQTANPAVQIVINEGGKEVYRGWLFSLYPSTHAFQHPRYSFSLVDFIPAAKKG